MDPLTKPRAAAFLSIKTQFDNLGDALINRELCVLAADRVRTLVDFSRSPVSFQRSMGVDQHPNVVAIRRFGYARLVASMLWYRLRGWHCYFFLNPGGLGGKKKSLKSIVSAAVYNILLGFLRMAGVRICHVGISFDPMDPPQLAIAKWRRRLLYSFAVRDQLSAEYLKTIRMPPDEIVPDLSFNLYRGVRPKKEETGRIAFSFRFDGKTESKVIAAAVHRITDRFGAEREFVFVSQVARDEPGMRALHRSCQEAGIRSSFLPCHDSIEQLLGAYAECEAIYSNRLHALLLAAHAGAAPYALVSSGAQPKIEGMFRDLGLDDRLVFLDDVDATNREVSPLDLSLFESEHRSLHNYFDRLLQTSSR